MRVRWLIPLALSALSPRAGAVCVHNVAEFQQALDNALGSATQVNIDVARGTYDLAGYQLNFMQSGADPQGRVDVTGGYNADCTTHIDNPALTVIDAHGMSNALVLYSTQGGLSVRYLTIQNGAPSGLAVSGTGVIVDYNIVRNNQGGGYTSGVGFAVAISTNAAAYDIQMDGNLVVGNSAGPPYDEYAAGTVYNPSGGDNHFTNNTIADNTVTGDSNCGGVGFYTSGTSYVSNSIFWHNSNCGLSTGTGATLIDNDYGSLTGPINAGSSGNLTTAPQFNGGGSYSLQADSPLLGQGTLTPVGGLPSIDLEGNPRSYKNKVDIGAYERGNLIYGDGFDD